MKKIAAAILSFILTIPFIYSEKFKISEGIYITEGNFSLTTTKSSILEKNYPLDKKTVFTEATLKSYINNYEQELKNTRFFQEINIEYETTGETVQEYSDVNSEDISLIRVIINVIDSNHFLLVPYASFKDDSSETKITPKIKAKDTNFLGSMNPLTSDLKIEIVKPKGEDWSFSPGFNISYDYPFKAGLFDLTWVNSYGIDFTFGDSSPEWDLKTGIKAELPFDRFSLILEGYQFFYRENDYVKYDDQIYFKDEVIFSTPISLYKLANYSYITYTPSVDFYVNWDSNSINELNDSLQGPVISFSHKLSNSKINWNNNYRHGYSLTLTNSWPYNFNSKEWSPSVSFEGQFFRYLKLEDRNYMDAIGLAIDFYTFTFLPFPSDKYDSAHSGYGEQIGGRIRGIADESYFGNLAPEYTTSTAVVINFDFPVNIINTNFKHDLINFDMQFSPFIDIAIYRDRQLPLQTDSIICAGMEVLVYPKKWSSFTIRGSIGFDLKSAISERNVIKGLLHNKEFSIGLGLHY